MDQFLNSRSINYGALLQFHHLRPHVQNHLARVHSAVFAGVAVATMTSYLAITSMPSLATLGQVGSFISVFMLMASGDRKSLPSMGRVGMFLTLSACMGASIAPYLAALIYQGMGDLIVSAAVASLTLFAVLSFAALVSPSRQFLLLGSTLGTGLTYLSLSHLLYYIFGWQLLVTLDLYLGLAIFSGYVLFDNQLAIYDAERGEKDYIQHAVDLFLDLVNLFIRILAILSENQKKKDNDRK